MIDVLCLECVTEGIPETLDYPYQWAGENVHLSEKNDLCLDILLVIRRVLFWI